MIVLGIETSCDETAAGVAATTQSGPRILSNLIQAQLAEHSPYGGVVPEIAARGAQGAADLDAGHTRQEQVELPPCSRARVQERSLDLHRSGARQEPRAAHDRRGCRRARDADGAQTEDRV